MQTIDALLRESPAFCASIPPSSSWSPAARRTPISQRTTCSSAKETRPTPSTSFAMEASPSRRRPARGSLLIETIEAGEVIGWSSLFSPYRWHFDARALTTIRATAFDGACLRGKCDDDPALGYALMSCFARIMIERLQWTRLRLLDVYGNGGAR